MRVFFDVKKPQVVKHAAYFQLVQFKTSLGKDFQFYGKYENNTMSKRHREPIPKQFWKYGRTGKVICQCGKNYGSEYDGLCTSCRNPKDQAKFEEFKQIQNGEFEL